MVLLPVCRLPVLRTQTGSGTGREGLWYASPELPRIRRSRRHIAPRRRTDGRHCGRESGDAVLSSHVYPLEFVLCPGNPRGGSWVAPWDLARSICQILVLNCKTRPRSEKAFAIANGPSVGCRWRGAMLFWAIRGTDEVTKTRGGCERQGSVLVCSSSHQPQLGGSILGTGVKSQCLKWSVFGPSFQTC